MLDIAITKRIKRHVIGPTQSFFAVTAPGLENLCYQELLSMPGTIGHVEVIFGGVAFEGRLSDIYRANLNLRTATRILMRIARFKASNFRQMERHLDRIPWELHILATTNLKVSVKAIHSRLYHTAAITDRIQHAIYKRVKGASQAFPVAAEDGVVQNLLVRVIDDRVVVSLDSSGAPLYKRGLKEGVGKAPLRETLAAAALVWAGYTGKEPLMDPMCGSGTFSLEAALMSRQTPPGWYRNFAFMNWPAFKTRQWQHLKKEHSLKITPLTSPMVFASDKDPTACVSLASVVRQFDLAEGVAVEAADFFDIAPSQFSRHPGIVTLNPPYGIRLGSITQAHGLYAEIAAKLRKDYRKWRAAIFLPDRRLITKFSSGLKQRKITHGGLDLTLLTGRID